MSEKMQCIKPFQPYILLQSENYQQIEKPYLGISHFYEFSISDVEQEIDAVPDGSVDLLFNIGSHKVQTYISGTVFHVKQWQMGEEHTCFGVRFQPGQGILPKEISRKMLVDRDILIDGNLFGADLEEQIAEARTLQERATIFQNAYEKMAAKEREYNDKKNVEEFVRKRIYETVGTITMNQISDETNYSPCYIRRIFKQYHGISPKQFAQCIRFQNLLGMLNTYSEKNEMVAQICGYYDEAHMMKEFKTNTGVTMEQYKKMMAQVQ